MKKSILILFAIVFFCSVRANAQQSHCETQRDSLQALYFFALSMMDSLVSKNYELTKQLDKKNSEIVKTKKLLADQTALREKLEGELKKSSQSKKKGQ